MFRSAAPILDGRGVAWRCLSGVHCTSPMAKDKPLVCATYEHGGFAETRAVVSENRRVDADGGARKPPASTITKNSNLPRHLRRAVLL